MLDAALQVHSFEVFVHTINVALTLMLATAASYCMCTAKIATAAMAVMALGNCQNGRQEGVLCRAVLRCAALCCAVLRCAALCCAVLRCAALYHAMPCCHASAVLLR